MQTLAQAGSELRAKLRRNVQPMTPEQYEAAKAKLYAQNCVCRPDCPECGGIGFISITGADGEPTGKTRTCPNIDPFRLYKSSRFGLDDKERDMTWDNVWDENSARRGVDAVRRAMERGCGWVYLWGPPGLAKTLILKIAVAEWLRDHKLAAYTRMAEIIDDMRGAFDARNPSEESAAKLEWWTNLPLLAIDEFDRVRNTEYANERRFLLMDKRYEQALRERSSITLMTSNEDPAKLESYLYDRIRDGRFEIIHLDGESVRPGMGW